MFLLVDHDCAEGCVCMSCTWCVIPAEGRRIGAGAHCVLLLPSLLNEAAGLCLRASLCLHLLGFFSLFLFLVHRS